LVALGSNQARAGHHDADYAWGAADSDRVSSSNGVSAVIHHLYVGHFERDRGAMKLEKRESDGAPRPVVVRPLDMAIVQKLLEEKGVATAIIPEDWRLGIEEEGFIVCERETPRRDAVDFIRKLARETGCDIVYDGMLFVSPDELTLAPDEPGRRAV
jgi:hypothetical protein